MGWKGAKKMLGDGPIPFLKVDIVVLVMIFTMTLSAAMAVVTDKSHCLLSLGCQMLF